MFFYYKLQFDFFFRRYSERFTSFPQFTVQLPLRKKKEIIPLRYQSSLRNQFRKVYDKSIPENLLILPVTDTFP